MFRVLKVQRHTQKNHFLVRKSTIQYNGQCANGIHKANVIYQKLNFEEFQLNFTLD